MGKALYRSYRSKTFDEVVGQKHITETLKNSLKNSTYAHAYLLTGPRGVGKTSVARLLAYAVNKTPYPAEPAPVDIIEIDAASNRRIDEIRDLRERVVIAPTSLKYKVYIIDEVHMLTREAFNALLKTLEEPPEHVIFILATTDIHKVPETIISRCLRFHFKPINASDISSHLASIAKSEKIKIDKEALDLIAVHSEGSFRDAIALLDQVRAHNKQITATDIERTIGLGSHKIIDGILASIINGNIKDLLEQIDTARAEGGQPQRIASQLTAKLRDELSSPTVGLETTQILSLVEDLIAVNGQLDTRAALEIALLKAAVQNLSESSEQPPAQGQQTSARDEKLDKAIESDLDAPQAAASEPRPADEELWHNVLDELKTKNRSVYGIARMASAVVGDDSLTLTFGFAFHQKQMSLARNKLYLIDILRKINPEIVTVDIKLDHQSPPVAKKDETMKNISNIFGAGELLES